MNAQEVFDRVVTHLLTQNRQAIADDGNCVYRAPNGLKCAVGCLIPDEAYSVRMENKGPIRVARMSPALSWMEEHNTLLIDLQLVHDIHEPHEWPELLGNIARNHALSLNLPRGAKTQQNG